jgi:hypothetical protein
MNEEFNEVAPDASVMIDSMGAHGYTLTGAIVHSIDNSITAQCKHVWLRLEWTAGRPWISISDAGMGITESEKELDSNYSLLFLRREEAI